MCDCEEGYRVGGRPLLTALLGWKHQASRLTKVLGVHRRREQVILLGRGRGGFAEDMTFT